MRRLSAWFAVLLGLPFALAQAAPTVQFYAPSSGGVVQRIEVSVTSTIEVASVTAVIGSVSTPLAFQTCSGTLCRWSSAWVGTPDLSSVPRGPATLTVRATDSLGGAGSASEPVMVDHAPVVQLMLPRAYTVARPSLRLQASCIDDDPAGCKSLDVIASDIAVSQTLAHGSGWLDAAASLSSWNGMEPTVAAMGMDSANQATSTTVAGSGVPVFVDDSPHLRQVAQVDGLIFDADATRILYLDNSAPPRMVIRDRATSADTVIHGSAPYMADRTQLPRLTSAGAVFVLGENLVTTPLRVLKSWENGALVELASANSVVLAAAKGQYVVWSDPAGLHRRDVSSGATVTVPGNTTYVADVAANGLVAFRTADYNIAIYSGGGTSTPITSDGPTVTNDGPVTDGTGVLYKRTPSGGSPAIVLHSGGATSVVASGSIGSGYLIEGGWIAFTVAGPSNVFQVWRQSPGGAQSQATFLSIHSGVQAITADGSLMTGDSSGRRSLSTVGSLPQPISTGLGRPIFMSGAWYVAMGNTLFAVVPVVVGATPMDVDFGVQSMGTRSAAVPIVLQNLGGSAVTPAVSVSAQFTQTNDCGTLQPAGTCTVNVVFAPAPTATALNGSLDVAGTLTIAVSGQASTLVALHGAAERSLVSHYYASILRRTPEPAGKAFWQSEASRVFMLGANLNETWFAMAMSFYGSAEYAGFARDNTGYVTDLYNTFFARPPDADGMAFWTSQLSSGLAREALVANFMLSPEFSAFAQSIFGNTAARAEVDVVMDFYRGLLSRLPDSGGFNAWVQYLRAAQCQGSTQVNAAVDALSAAFVGSVEYGNRARGNAQYVSDLYNAFMRRGADLDGQRFWTGRLNFGITRDELRRAFLQSPEFQQRVGAVVTQGCAN